MLPEDICEYSALYTGHTVTDIWLMYSWVYKLYTHFHSPNPKVTPYEKAQWVGLMAGKKTNREDTQGME